jgi:hypothetical protein
VSIPTTEVTVEFRGENIKAYTFPTTNITFRNIYIPDGCPVCHGEPKEARALIRSGWLYGRYTDRLVGQIIPCGHFFGGYSWQPEENPLNTKVVLSTADEDYLQEWASISEERSLHDLP